jgi:peptidoglycan/xylan/chitin deacetylase (PgdA/CDA1 family)
MGTYQSQYELPRRWDYWTVLQRFLLILIILSLVRITALLFTVAQTSYGPDMGEQYPTPSPVVFVSSTPRPSPTPSPPPSVLRYPLYSGNPYLPEIALTFDDGPKPLYTSQILAILQKYSVKATFNVIGSQAAAYPALVQQESRQGNIIGNHTWTHPQLTHLSPAAVRHELQSTSNKIQADTGVLPTVFRPPYGKFNSSVQSIAASLGLSTVLWNVDPKDWSRPGTNAIIQNVLKSVHNGSIILLHDGGGNRSETVAALPTIITRLDQRGFQFITIPRMIQDLPSQGTGPAQIAPDQLSP